MSEQRYSDDEIAAALREHGSISAAWRALGGGTKAPGSFRHRCRRVMSRDPQAVLDARAGNAPGQDVDTAIPPGMYLRGTSSLYRVGANGERELALQWVRAAADQEAQLQAWIDAMPALLDPIRGAAEPTPAPETDSADLLTGYIIGDGHIGMLSWAPETGANFDLAIAERLMRGAIDRLLMVTPASDECLIVNVGDLQHADDPSNRTPASGNQLDVDGRDPKVRRAVLRIIRYYIDSALTKHRVVRLVNTPGNHDPQATIWLGLCLEALYEREPRVLIDTSPAWFRVHEFGSNMIVTTHGNTVKAQDLPLLAATRWPDIWGRTKHRICLTGHVHHHTRRDFTGASVETFRTLAPADAWHSQQGYMSQRDMTAIVWHREHGEDARYRVGVGRLA